MTPVLNYPPWALSLLKEAVAPPTASTELRVQQPPTPARRVHCSGNEETKTTKKQPKRREQTVEGHLARWLRCQSPQTMHTKDGNFLSPQLMWHKFPENITGCESESVSCICLEEWPNYNGFKQLSRTALLPRPGTAYLKHQSSVFSNTLVYHQILFFSWVLLKKKKSKLKENHYHKHPLRISLG